MLDPKAITERLLGAVEWENPTSGFCRCPGAATHTTATGRRDCRVRIDGAPTIYCFHSTCLPAVRSGNTELRRQLGQEHWTLQLPDGRVLQAGENACGTLRRRSEAKDKKLLEDLELGAMERLDRLLEDHPWTYEQICDASPVGLQGLDPEAQFRLWLKLWPPESTLWMGDTFDSGSPAAQGHFRPVSEWYEIGPVMGPFTSGSSFKPGCFARTEANINRREFLVVESDTLSRDEIGSVFRWLQRRLHYELHCIVDTGGKSLHGWFSPPSAEQEPLLRAALAGLGCDTKLFTRSQPVRLPGAWRGDALQRLIWLRTAASRTESRDVAVELGLRPHRPDRALYLDEMIANPPDPPPELVAGMLHQGTKMLLGGTSKSNKSWCLLDLGLSVAAGAPWWGQATTAGHVLYLNFELSKWAIPKRISAICQARPDLKHIGRKFQSWNLRGFASDITALQAELERLVDQNQTRMIIVDPMYKLLGDRDENSNGEIAQLLNQLERIAEWSGAAVVMAHHFAKGDASAKEAIDRMSGAGVWARDPDSILVLTPHEEAGCFAVTTILRNFPIKPDFVVSWEFPLMRVVGDLDPANVRRSTGRPKTCTDREFVARFVGTDGLTRQKIIEAARAEDISERTVDRYLKRLTALGMLRHSSGLYWLKNP